MANPQTENGFTKIANEILEKLSLYGINGSEYRIILLVIRKTYGFGKKKDKISLTQFQKGTLMNRAQAVKTIKTLVCKRILLKENNGYIFNKNWEQWVVHKRIPSMQKDTTASMQKHTKSSMQKHTHKRKKETITKENIAKQSFAPLIVEVIDSFKDINPSYSRWYNNKTQRAACERLIRLHGLEMLKKVIRLLPQTNEMPYITTITTPVQLEDNWAKWESHVKKKKAELENNKTKIIL